MVVWLLQYRQITQLHTYVYIVPLIQMAHLPGSFSPTSSGFGSDHTAFDSAPFSLRPLSRSSDSGQTDESGEQIIEAALLQHLSQEEKQSVLQTMAAADIDDLELFARFSKYFHGSHHLEEIMLLENIPRSQLLTLIDKFSEVLVTCTLPEHSRLHGSDR